ncbi:MAG: type IV pilus assembly protein PilM [Candidatus Saccharimonadales bacterium]
MSLLSGVSEFFSLDIGSSAVRAVQVTNSPKSKQLMKYAISPVDAKVALSDSKSDQLKLMQSIKEMLASAQITTKDVVVGIPSSRVFTTVVDIERIPLKELAKTIRYQADGLIPTPIAESKIDWAVIGDSPKSPNKLEILISSVSNDFIEPRLDLIESIGLNVIAFEPDNLALVRSMIAPDDASPNMIIDIGSKSTDIVIAMNGVSHLTRAIPTGSETIIRSAMQNLNIDEKQAQEFVFKFGLSQQKLEGQVYQAIVNTVNLLMTDIDKSIKFFESRYEGVKLNRIIMTGGASSLPEFPLYIANKFGINVEIGNAWRNIQYDLPRQNELMALSNHFGVATGLAERNE